jgi:hypothetical protein
LPTPSIRKVKLDPEFQDLINKWNFHQTQATILLYNLIARNQLKAQAAWDLSQSNLSTQTPKPQLAVQTQELPTIYTQPFTPVFGETPTSAVAQPGNSPNPQLTPYQVQWTPYPQTNNPFLVQLGEPQPSPSVEEEILHPVLQPTRTETVTPVQTRSRRLSHPTTSNSIPKRGRNQTPKSTVVITRKRQPST